MMGMDTLDLALKLFTIFGALFTLYMTWLVRK